MWIHEEKIDRSGNLRGESWTLKTKKGMTATIIKGHIYHKNGYVLHCYPLGIDTRVLNGETVEDIIKHAKIELSEKLNESIDKLNELKELLGEQ